MKVLITGASGFVAPHLARELRAHGHEVSLTSRHPKAVSKLYRGSHVYACDLNNVGGIERILKQVRPDAIVHLAGATQSKPESNLGVMQRLCAALTRYRHPLRLLFVSSGFVYGSANRLRRFTEKDAPAPLNSYGSSKWMAEQFLLRHTPRNVRVWIARPFNHTGPGQSASYAAPAFAKRIAKARSGGSIKTGDLRPVRDFSDVRDIVRAYRLILEKRPAERLFVLGSGRAVRMRNLFQTLARISGKRLTPALDPALSTSKEVSCLVGNPALARRALGWRCQIPLKRTLRDVYRANK